MQKLVTDVHLEYLDLELPSMQTLLSHYQQHALYDIFEVHCSPWLLSVLSLATSIANKLLVLHDEQHAINTS